MSPHIVAASTDSRQLSSAGTFVSKSIREDFKIDLVLSVIDWTDES